MISSKKELAGYIDHTVLKVDAVAADIEKLCKEADEYGFYSVCVNAKWVPVAADLLRDSDAKVCSVVGFPLGAELPGIKAAQAKAAIMAGADEIDMVADIAAIIEGDEKTVVEDIGSVLEVCKSFRPGVVLKVIIEAAVLTDEQIVFVCEIANRLGVDFVKTSTGFNPAGGASVEAVALMKRSAPHCKVKASGGIRTYDQAIAMIEAGAERIGTSASIVILNS